MQIKSIFISLVLLISWVALQAFAKNQPGLAPHMHPDVVLAKQGAPEHVSAEATIMVWQGDKFSTLIHGGNSFTCLVLRDDKGRYEPSCLNKAAMQAVFPVYEYQTAQLAKGNNIKTIHANIKKMAKAGTFTAPAPGAVVYMMAEDNKYYDHFSNTLMDISPHIMLYYPALDAAELGFDGDNGIPMFYDEYPHLSVVHIHTDILREGGL